MKRTHQDGQALVETALALPVLLAMILAIFSLGHLFSSQQVVTNATREGARQGTLGKSTGEISQTIGAYLISANLQEAATVEVLGAGSPSGSQLTVKVTYPLKLAIPVPGFPESVALKAQTIMRIE